MNRASSLLPRALAALFLLLHQAAPAAADVLTLNGGRELFGEIVSITTAEARLRTGTGEIALPVASLLDAGFLRSYGVAGESVPADVKDPLLSGALAAPPTAKDYPNAASVVLLDEGILEARADGTTVYTERIVSFILKERGRDEANLTFAFDPELETVTLLRARALTPAGVFPADDRAVSLESAHAGSPGYEREKNLKCAIPESNPGAILERQIRTERKASPPDRPFRIDFRFRGEEPVRLARFVFRRPAACPLAFHVRTGEASLTRADAVEGETLVTTLTATDVPGVAQEAYTPPEARDAPCATVADPADPAGLSARYLAELDALRGELPRAAKAAHALAGGKLSGRDGAAALHDAFVRDVVTDGVPMADYSFLPTRPAERLERKLASVLDKTFLYYALARAAGLPVTFCLVRTHGEGPLSDGPFSLSAFDAACIRLDLPEGPEYFAPVYENHRFGVLPEGWQGADALPLDGSAKVVALPVSDGRASGIERTATGRLLPDGALEVTADETWRGLYDAALRPLKQASDDERRKWAEKRLNEAHPKAKLQEFALANLDDLSRDVTVRMVYRVEDFAVRAGPYTLFRMPGLQRGAFAVGDPARVNPLYWGAPECEATRVELSLPEGASLHHLPPPRSTVRPGYSYVAGCGYSAGRVIFSDRLERTALCAPRAEYGRYKEFVEAAVTFLREWVVLAGPEGR